MAHASQVLFLADFNSNAAILSQLHALTSLCESFPKTLTISVPYFPMATMGATPWHTTPDPCPPERVLEEGTVATANSEESSSWMYPHMCTQRLRACSRRCPTSGLRRESWHSTSTLSRRTPPGNATTADPGLLQNRFYFHSNALATLHSTIPLINQVMKQPSCTITAVAFPDEGAQKRRICVHAWVLVLIGLGSGEISRDSP